MATYSLSETLDWDDSNNKPHLCSTSCGHLHYVAVAANFFHSDSAMITTAARY